MAIGDLHGRIRAHRQRAPARERLARLVDRWLGGTSLRKASALLGEVARLGCD